MRVGAVDYERHGLTYARHRRADPRIARRIHAALGDAATVLNVGAGAGSYEPDDRWVLAVEPSAAMRAQRPPGSAPALAASAELLPLDDGAVQAAMACVTVHHWDPLERGLAEMRRVASGPVVVFTFDLEALPAWQREFLREGLERERPRFRSPEEVARLLGGRTRIERLPTQRTAPMGSSRPSGTGRRRCSTRRCAARSRCGRWSVRSASGRWWSAWRGR